jgi:tetratricopeptide (TPR) repeat protein
LKAVYYGKKARSILSGLVEENPDLYDAYYGVGLYNYSAASVPTALDLLLGVFGIGRDKKLGMYQLNLAAEHGTWTRVEVSVVLSQLHFYYENNYDEAIKVLLPLVNQFPSNPVFQKYLAMSYFKLARYEEAIHVYEGQFADTAIQYISGS